MDTPLRILLHLAKHRRERFTMHGLASTLRIPYTTFHRTMKRLKGLVIVEEVGKAKTLRLDLENEVLASHLTIASWQERTEFLARQPVINVIAHELPADQVVLLFGSYAKGTQRERSDIDIIVLNEKGERTVSFSKYELLYKKEINPFFFTEEEFKLMLAEREENVGTQALEGHIVLREPERFWGIVLAALRQRGI